MLVSLTILSGLLLVLALDRALKLIEYLTGADITEYIDDDDEDGEEFYT
jgi:hypothetical protein